MRGASSSAGRKPTAQSGSGRGLGGRVFGRDERRGVSTQAGARRHRPPGASKLTLASRHGPVTAAKGGAPAVPRAGAHAAGTGDGAATPAGSWAVPDDVET